MGRAEMPSAPPRPALRQGDVPASAVARRISIALDLGILLLSLLVVLGVLMQLGSPRHVIITVLCSLAGLLGIAWWQLRRLTGSSPGHALTRLRTVDDATGMPGRPRWRSRDRTALDTRAGLDPLHPSPGRFALPARRADPAGRRSASLLLIADDGSTHSMLGPVAIGRDVRALRAVPGASPLVFADFGHTLDALHASVAPGPGHVTVRALSITHPTWVDDGWERRRLEAQGTVDLAPGAVFGLGDRTFRVATRSARPERGAR